MDYNTNYESWLADPAIDDDTKDELRAIADNKAEIEDRFHKDLAFGTGGLRGVLGAGSNRMNIYTVRKATQGLANYIRSQVNVADTPSVAIAHDCRRMSPEFSREAALVLNANGIKTYVFDALRPTPFLSFAVRHLQCTAGIVITASHNPPEYNGYKVYWTDGGQVPYPRDEAIIDEVNAVAGFAQIKTMPHAAAVAAGLYHVAGPGVDDAYIAQVKAQCRNPEIIPQSDLCIVYTPLHGAGNVPVRRALAETGFCKVYGVPEQDAPDGNFPTVAYPNPEDRKAFALALAKAAEVGADIVIATDPDSDRVGVAIRDNAPEQMAQPEQSAQPAQLAPSNQPTQSAQPAPSAQSTQPAQPTYTLLSGNMTGVLLTEYLLSQMKAHDTLPANGAIISTIVSTGMTKAVAEAYGIAYFDVLTGFKYIGEKIKEFEESGAYTYLFGFEESYGCLAGTYARDKDAVAAALLVCEAAAYYRRQGKTLLDVLEECYGRYGLYQESVDSITLKGVEGLNDMKRLMTALREKPLRTVAGVPVTTVRDYLNETVFNAATEELLTHATHLPISDVLHYTLADGSWFCVRPSGTEPKVKLYFGVCVKDDADNDADNDADDDADNDADNDNDACKDADNAPCENLCDNACENLCDNACENPCAPPCVCCDLTEARKTAATRLSAMAEALHKVVEEVLAVRADAL